MSEELPRVWLWQQAWRLHVYHLKISAAGKLLRSGTPVAAAQALRDWFKEETTGYQVTCHDESGALVTRGQLRKAAQHRPAT
jgi:hypothetical protein